MLKTSLIYGLITCVVIMLLVVAWIYFQKDKELLAKQKEEMEREKKQLDSKSVLENHQE